MAKLAPKLRKDLPPIGIGVSLVRRPAPHGLPEERRVGALSSGSPAPSRESVGDVGDDRPGPERKVGFGRLLAAEVSVRGLERARGDRARAGTKSVQCSVRDRATAVASLELDYPRALSLEEAFQLLEDRGFPLRGGPTTASVRPEFSARPWIARRTCDGVVGTRYPFSYPSPKDLTLSHPAGEENSVQTQSV